MQQAFHKANQSIHYYFYFFLSSDIATLKLCIPRYQWRSSNVLDGFLFPDRHSPFIQDKNAISRTICCTKVCPQSAGKLMSVWQLQRLWGRNLHLAEGPSRGVIGKEDISVNLTNYHYILGRLF